jgi:hypothetical protein
MTDIQKQLAEALERCVNAIQNIGGEHVTDLVNALAAADEAQAALAAHRQQETRKPLTVVELRRLADFCTPKTETGALNYLKFARAVESVHGIKGE